MMKKTHRSSRWRSARSRRSTAPRCADEPYIPLISKGFQHQFWQAVKAGAEQAAKADNVKITFEGPETEAMVDKQIDMLVGRARQEAAGASASPRSTARRPFRC